MSIRAWCSAIGLLAVCSLGLRGQAQPSPTTSAFLDRYAAGQFDAVVADLEAQNDFEQILKDLKNHGDEWIAAGAPADRGRRELAAATFALEAARVDEWREWKWIQASPAGPLPTLWWMPPPLLIEWGCERFRRDEVPRPIERVWQLAALSVAARSEDAQFLIGFTKLLSSGSGGLLPPPKLPPDAPLYLKQLMERAQQRRGIEVINTQDEIGHLNHVMERFPFEPRFVLAQGIARQIDASDDAAEIYNLLGDDPVVGGEALTRLASLQLRRNRTADALASLDRAERMTRDPYVLYLARLFRGMTLQQMRRDADAVPAYRGALLVRPGGESASVRLAELLFKAGDRTAAQTVMADALAADTSIPDPYTELVHGDDRFWPQLIARLRREIKP